MQLREILQTDNLIIMGCHEYPISPEIHFWGGMGEVCKNVSERLVHRGFEVLVLARQTEDYAAKNTFFAQKNGVYVFSPPVQKFQAGAENTDLYMVYPCSENIKVLDHNFTVWKHLQRNGLSKKAILHGHDWMSVGWLRQAHQKGMPTVLTVHMSVDRTSGDKRLELERMAGEYADVIHYVSLSQRKSCRRYPWDNSKSHVVIPNGVDTQKFTPPKKSPTEDYVLFVGRLTPVKRVPALVEGWSKFNKNFPEVKLKILGAPGMDNLNVQRAIHRLDKSQQEKVELRIEMVSLYERIRYYQNATVCCFPSVREAFGVVAVEAQACGKPVVVGSVGGFWENVLEGITGVHVDGYSASSIAEGLEVAYLNRHTWGRNARSLVLQFFDWNKIVDEYVERLYKPLL